MPKPVRAGQRYVPALDGLRALAVLAVIAYHEQFGWAPGGMLGVGVFFTLSGYLITSLLLAQWNADGRMHLGQFWLARARRLLPALFVMLAVVTAWVTIADRARLASLRGAVAAAATYSSNWYAVVQQRSYFARFAPPGPLDHLWSLAVEEQFYLLWPSLLLLLLLLFFAARRRGKRGAGPDDARGTRRVLLALITAAMAVASAVEMLRLYQPGLDPTRVYEGTDTRAFGLLIGATLAMLSTGAVRAHAKPRLGLRALLDGAGVAGLAVIGLLIWRTGQYSPFVYRGGLVLLSVATAAVLAAAAAPGSMVGRALGWRPLRWLGVRSYGIYLWHFPVIALTTPPNAGPDLPRATAQIAASIAAAALSWRFIEEPIRHGAIGRAWARLRTSGWRTWRAGVGATAAVTAASAVLAVAVAGLDGSVRAPAGGSSSELAGAAALPQATKSVTRAGPRPQFVGAAHSSAPRAPHAAGGQHTAGAPHAAAAAGATDTGPPRTSCQAVAHIGDSTSDGLVSPDYLPNPATRIPARYEDVGARSVRTDISGGRSIAEVLPGQTNGADAARAMVREGFRGCWVLALGTDDTADVSAGSLVSLPTRIARMMSATRGEPVMWVNVKSLQSSGPYAESSMQRWNSALVRACARYPNMRIFDWAAAVRRKWFISDGIHYTSAGYKARAELIADALAKAFPAGGHSSDCVIR
jgi:peptidoglycan/LPS O-acetylase OafA/YrhL